MVQNQMNQMVQNQMNKMVQNQMIQKYKENTERNFNLP